VIGMETNSPQPAEEKRQDGEDQGGHLGGLLFPQRWLVSLKNAKGCNLRLVLPTLGNLPGREPAGHRRLTNTKRGSNAFLGFPYLF
jgi:hypothetical protein